MGAYCCFLKNPTPLPSTLAPPSTPPPTPPVTKVSGLQELRPPTPDDVDIPPPENVDQGSTTKKPDSHPLGELGIIICSHSELTPEAMRTVFETVRILVVGKSGSGKTTLIRLLLGKDGPQQLGSSDGLPGQQDIEREWRWTANERLPLVIHDSNGMDVGSGRTNLDTVRNFINDRQRNSNVSSRIHLIWYVIGANDNRIADECDLMATVATAGVPILLIQTYNDIQKLVQQHVTPKVLDNLFRSVPLDLSGEIRRRMVRIGNAVRVEKSTGEIKGFIDYKGLIRISHRSMRLLDKHLKYTWIAAQVVDLQSKLDATVHLILETSRRALTTDLFRLKPSVKLTSAFNNLHERVCKIWRVPDALSAALFETIVEPQLEAAIADASRARHGSDSAVEALIRFLGFVVRLGAKEVTFRVNVVGMVTAEVCLKYDESKREESRWTWRIFTCGVRLLMAVLFLQLQGEMGQQPQQQWRISGDYCRMLTTEFEETLQQKIDKKWVESLLPLLPSTASDRSNNNNTAFLLKVLLRRKDLSELIADFALKHYKLYLLRRQNPLFKDGKTGQSSSTMTDDDDDELELSFLSDSIFASNDDDEVIQEQGTPENECGNDFEAPMIGTTPQNNCVPNADEAIKTTSKNVCGNEEEVSVTRTTSKNNSGHDKVIGITSKNECGNNFAVNNHVVF